MQLRPFCQVALSVASHAAYRLIRTQSGEHGYFRDLEALLLSPVRTHYSGMFTTE